MTFAHLVVRTIKKYQMLLLGVAVTIAIAFFFILFLRAHIGTFSNLLVQDDVFRVEEGVMTDAQYVAAEILRMSEDPEIVSNIAERDLFKLYPYLKDREAQQGIDLTIATDKEGVVLARTKETARLGEYVFETTLLGNKVSEGTRVISIEQSELTPLMIIAGQPVGSAGVRVGALFGGFIIDDDYAAYFKRTYLNDSNDEIVFYSLQEGVVGSSFNDPKIKALLIAYFNTGGDWTQSGRSGGEVLIQEKRYFVKNLSLRGLEENGGGVLVFSSINTDAESIILGVLALILFLIGVLLFTPKRQQMTEQFVVVLFFGSVIILFVVANLGKLVHDVYPIHIEHTPYKIYNSTISLEPSSGIASREFEQRIAIKVGSGGEAINAAQVVLTYDPYIMRVEDIITTNSFCDSGMFLETKIDNMRGEVRIVCALPSPGFSKNSGILAEITVQPLVEGTMDINFGAETEILANDGLGTNVLRQASGGSYRVTGGSEVAQSVLAFSPTHPNSGRWYNKKDIRFLWQRKPDTRYVYTFDHSASTTILDARSATTSSTAFFKDQKEGVYYFHIAALVDNKLSKVSTTKINIDTTPPAIPTIRASATRVAAGDIVRLAFASSDHGSGLQRNFYVRFNKGVFLPVASTVSIVFPVGMHTVTLRAFDQAGNYSDGSISIEAVNPLSMSALLFGATSK